ncbi:MAG: tryptophan--tRNA ligase [Candidatus Buchananbacteria bacterium]
MMKKVILTGDRPTGPLHLGHYVGSLKKRIELQREYDTYILVADVQALTDNAENPEKIRKNILEVALDYMAVGIDPNQATIVIQSLVPEIAELTVYYLNLVTLARLQRNPTVKNEMKQKGFGANVPVGFLMYPISQAADITAFNADLVPVGEDQMPVIEQTVEIVRAFNRIYKPVLVEPKGLVSEVGRLSGIDGQAKMGKSLGNAIYLSDSRDDLAKKIKSMYTDPNHIRVEDPGTVKGNIVFEYLDAFDYDLDEVKKLKSQYKAGGLGDVLVKKRLLEVLDNFLKPIRERRAEFAKDPAQIMKMLEAGTNKAREKTSQTLKKVKEAMMLDYFE